SYGYDPAGHALTFTDTPYSNGAPQSPTTYSYGVNVHDSVDLLVNPSGNVSASYGYQPYGQADTTLTQGDTNTTSPLNPVRFEQKRLDSGSQSYNTGARNYSPAGDHFLTPDYFHGALADLQLSTDPLTQDRYALTGGNPVSFIDWSGHMLASDGSAGGMPAQYNQQTIGGPASIPTNPYTSGPNGFAYTREGKFIESLRAAAASQKPGFGAASEDAAQQNCAITAGSKYICQGVDKGCTYVGSNMKCPDANGSYTLTQDQYEPHVSLQDVAGAALNLALFAADALDQEIPGLDVVTDAATVERMAAAATEDASALATDAGGFGPFYRLETSTQTPEVAAQQEASGQIWGRTPFGGIKPAVQAYPGALPEGERGIEFFTDVAPDSPYGPIAQWTGPRAGVEVDENEEFAKICVLIAQNTQC
ncbi:MAG: hypothetical protein LBV34_10880, partial [Nocardiopsaceae bacterium]|nr:hypothetical protein [Nocardiopsaceae bacterium]